MSFSPRSLHFVIPQTHAEPPTATPTLAGAAVNRCSSVLSEAVSTLLVFQLTSDNPSVVTSRFISFKSQAASISPYFQPAGVSAVCAFTRRNAQRLRPKTFPWKWSPWTQPKNDTVSTEHPSIHPSEIPVKHLPASPRPRANPPQPPARRRLPPGA